MDAFLVPDRRLQALQLLAQAPGGVAPDRALLAGLEARGHRPSLEALRNDLHWLQEMLLVEFSPGAWSVRITARGAEAARGRVKVYGMGTATAAQASPGASGDDARNLAALALEHQSAEALRGRQVTAAQAVTAVLRAGAEGEAVELARRAEDLMATERLHGRAMTAAQAVAACGGPQRC